MGRFDYGLRKKTNLLIRIAAGFIALLMLPLGIIDLVSRINQDSQTEGSGLPMGALWIVFGTGCLIVAIRGSLLRSNK